MFIHPVDLVIVLSIVAFGSLAWIFATRPKQGAAKVGSATGASEIASLRQRLEVLEQIATDPATRLDREIEVLRSNR